METPGVMMVKEMDEKEGPSSSFLQRPCKPFIVLTFAPISAIGDYSSDMASPHLDPPVNLG